MADEFQVLRLDTATQALRALAQLSERIHDNRRRQETLRPLLVTAEPRLLADDEASATIYWPIHAHARRTERELEQFIGIVQQSTSRTESLTAAATPQDAEPLAAGLPLLLSRTGQFSQGTAPRAARRSHLAAVPVPAQRLYVVPGLDLEASAAWFVRFQAAATQVRTARHDAGGAPVQFYCLADDPDRGSVVGSLIARYGPGTMPLSGYRGSAAGRDWLVFMPPGQIPSRDGLDAFCSLLVSVPGLFGPLSDAPSEGILAALDRPGSAYDTPHLYYLGRLRFYDQWELTTDWPEVRAIEISQLSDTPEAMKQLGAEIADARPRLGYRLQLEPTTYTDPNQDNLAYLQRQLFDIEQQIADLTGFNKTRPRLLRFGPHQLPAMADVLRFYPAVSLPRLRYGFHASPGRGAGEHYLLIDPQDAALAEADPLLFWLRSGEPAMDFWLDPYWARTYWPHNQHMVFVPYGWTLTPALHSWKVASMDDHLRQMVTTLSPPPSPPTRGARRQGGGVVPAEPLYVFDHADDRIDIVVLDRAGFTPLQTNLEWLNDNLRLIETWGDARQFINNLATEAGRLALAQQMETQAVSAEKRARALVDEFERDAAAGVASVLKTITAEVDRLATEGEQLVSRARDLNAQLEAIKAFHASTQAQVTDTNKAMEQTAGAEVEQLRHYYRNLTATVNGAIQQSEQTRNELTRDINRMVVDLTETRQRLRVRLEQLRQEGDRP